MIQIKPKNVGYQPSVDDILAFYKNEGVVGEEENCILITLSAIHKLPVGVEAPAGSGKTVITDRLIKLLPKDKVYNMGLMSGTAAAYDNKRINESWWIFIEELQKAMNSSNPIMVELLKNLTEGKDLNRKTVEMTADGFRTKKQHIKGDKGIIYTLALENKLKKDEELGRRVLVFSTDITEKQNKKVVVAEGKRRFKKPKETIITEEKINQLTKHIETATSLSLKIQNPFAEYIAKLIPTPNVIVRSYFKHYLNLMEASARFYFKERLMNDGNLFMSIQDVQLIHKLYGKTFLNSIHHINNYGAKIMELFSGKIKYGHKKNKKQQELFESIEQENDKIYLNIDDIHKGLKDKNILLKRKVLKDQCDLLIEAGFLGKEKQGNKEYYFKTDYIEDFEDKINWNKCLESGKKLMKENYPEIYDEWLKTNKPILKTDEKEIERKERESDIEILKNYMELCLEKKERVRLQNLLDLGFTEDFVEWCKSSGFLIELKPDDFRWV